MPLTSAPSLRIIRRANGTKKNTTVVTGAYRFDTDAKVSQALGSMTFTGTVWTVDLSSAFGPASANLPEMRSLQFSASFMTIMQDTTTIVGDGELFVFIPSSGQLLRFGAAATNYTGTPGALGTENAIVTACVPILADAPTIVQFGKSVDTTAAHNLWGGINIALTDAELQAFVVENYL